VELKYAAWIGLLAAFAVVTDSVVCKSQQPIADATRSSMTPATGSGRIMGVVVDSLHGQPLINADVLAEGTTVAIAHTDSSGSFSIKGVQPGKYRLVVSHPMLDTLGMWLATPDFIVSLTVSFLYASAYPRRQE
jgi:hypothetical protein